MFFPRLYLPLAPVSCLFFCLHLGLVAAGFQNAWFLFPFLPRHFFLAPFPVILQNRCQFLGLPYLINTETGLIHGNCIVHIIFITFLPLIVFVFPLWFLSHWLILKFFLFDVCVISGLTLL